MGFNRIKGGCTIPALINYEWRQTEAGSGYWNLHVKTLAVISY